MTAVSADLARPVANNFGPLPASAVHRQGGIRCFWVDGQKLRMRTLPLLHLGVRLPKPAL